MTRRSKQIFLMLLAAILLFAGLYFGADFDLRTSVFVAVVATVISFFTLSNRERNK